MIASFPIAAGVTGGVVPTGASPSATPAPVIDGFDALLGQLTAALLATAAEARAGDGAAFGPASASRADAVDDRDHDAVDPAATLPIVSPLPFQAAPHEWLPAAIEGAGPDSSTEQGVDATPPHAGGAPHQAWPPADVAATAGRHTGAAADLGPTGAPDIATGMHVEAPLPVTSPSPVDPLPFEMPLVDMSPPSRNPAPLPFELVPHERPTGRRSGSVSVPVAQPVSDPVAPAAMATVSPTTIAPAASSVVSPTAELAEAPASVAEPSAPSRSTAPLPFEPFEQLPHEGPLARRIGPARAVGVDAAASVPSKSDFTAGANAAAFPHGDGPAVSEEAAPAAPAVALVAALGAGAGAASPAPAAPPAASARARALAGALAARFERRPEQAPPPGLVGQAGRALAAFERNGPSLGNDTGTRHPRGAVPPPLAAGLVTMPVAGSPAIDASPGGPERGAPVAPFIGPTWRAALATSDGAALAAPASAASAPMSPVTSLGLLVRPPVDDLPVPLDATTIERPTLDQATGESVHGQIVRSLKLQWAGTLGEARVTLRPEFLGEVVATITVDKGVVSATLQADTPEVRRWMEAHTTSLRDALVEHGLRLDRLTVAEPARESADADRQGRPRGRQPETPTPRPRRRAPESQTPQFDVTP